MDEIEQQDYLRSMQRAAAAARNASEAGSAPEREAWALTAQAWVAIARESREEVAARGEETPALGA